MLSNVCIIIQFHMCPKGENLIPHISIRHTLTQTSLCYLADKADNWMNRASQLIKNELNIK